MEWPFSDSERGSGRSEDLGDQRADIHIAPPCSHAPTCIHNWKHTQPTAHYSANWTGSINLKVNGKPLHVCTSCNHRTIVSNDRYRLFGLG